MSRINIFHFLGSILVCFSAGLIGSLFTYAVIPTWYASLNKPFFNPPNWIFGPVWTTLYFMMGISLFLVWEKKGKKDFKKKGLTYFFIQLILNAAWSIVFFGLQSPLFAIFVIIGLWIMIVLTIKNFYIITKTAGFLLIPYLAWVSFATILNVSIALLNR